MIHMEELVTIKGKITYILFHNPSNDYTVAKFVLDDEDEQITITGILPDAKEDILYRFLGNYTQHPKYGFQFQVQAIEQVLPTERVGIIRYLSSSKFKGVGKKMAENIVAVLGENCLEEIKEYPDCLFRVNKLTKKQYDVIVAGIQENDGLQELVSFFNIHGIGTRNLQRLQQAYGNQAFTKIKENPYRLVEEVDGFGFITADKIADALGIQKDDPRRLHAYLLSLCMDMCMKNGDSFVYEEDLQQNYEKKIRGMQIDFESTLQSCIDSKALVKYENKIFPISQYQSECTIAHFLAAFPYQKIEQKEKNEIQDTIQTYEKQIGITYDNLQKEAIETFFQHPFSIITGGPGTGKTTLVRAIVSLFHKLYPNYDIQCVAPTGRAAKRLAELTKAPSLTIHSLLQWNLETNEFKKNQRDPLTCDVLIIDEFSMVDAYVFANLLKASKQIKKICIIGDEDQLPSVSPGCLLRDLIASDVFPVIRLSHIFRQQKGSGVICLAHDIKEGSISFDTYKDDISFFETDSVHIQHFVVQIVKNAIAKNYSWDEIQVLSPMYQGNAGIHVLNAALQEAFNPHVATKKEVKINYTILREGDKVLQLKNQPDEDVFNGDIGFIYEIIDAKESEDHRTTIVVDFDGNFVEYKPETFQNITLAYCISVHKSQGSEYPIVIMPFVKQHTIMLDKKLIYTAITRSRKSLVMLGDKQVFLDGIQKGDRHIRQTTLQKRIEEAFLKIDDAF